MFYNRVNTSEHEYESVRGLDYEEEIDLDDNQDNKEFHSTRWNRLVDKFIATPFAWIIQFLSQYRFFNFVIDGAFEIKFWWDSKFIDRPYLKPIILFILIALGLTGCGLIGYRNYLAYVHGLAEFKDMDLSFNQQIAKLVSEVTIDNGKKSSETLNKLLKNYTHDYMTLSPQEQYRINLYHQLRDANQIAENESGFGWLNRFLKGSNNRAMDIRWDALDRLRREQVRYSFLHAWNGYKKIAWGHDIASPLKQGYEDSNLGIGLTIFDNLDTLFMLGLNNEYEIAKKKALEVDFTELSGKLEFQSLIRQVLGGLLGAHELTSDDNLLAKAEEVAQLSILAFDTTHGLPSPQFETNGRASNIKSATLDQIATFQLEYIKLSQLTQNTTFAKKVDRVNNWIALMTLDKFHLYPQNVDLESATLSDVAGLGPRSGRFYEVLLKQDLLSDDKTGKLKGRYLNSLIQIQEKLIIRHELSSSSFISDYERGKPNYDMWHHSCFFPGLLAFGSSRLERSDDLYLAKKLAKTCYTLYTSTPSNLAPNKVHVQGPNKDDFFSIVQSYTNAAFFHEHRFAIYEPNFELSSEFVETLFYLYRETGDRRYQDMGWNIFMGIETHLKVKYGYVGYTNVLLNRTYDNTQSTLQITMPSHFMSRTLKYLYLLFSPREQVPPRSATEANPIALSADFFLDLDKYILTPGGHPLKKFGL